MPQLVERQRHFAEALLDSELPMPPGLIGPDGKPSERRFAVYRNNVVAGLIDTLQAAFRAVHRIVGAEFFRAMARVYAANRPPASPIMLRYGESFPDFIEAFAPAATLPYLADVARVERAWTEAYHACDAAPIDPAILMSVPPDALPALQLRLHPSVRIVRSRFPALTIWHMNVGDGVPHPIDVDSGGEDILVTRPEADVELRALPDGGADFLSALLGGLSVLEATKSALISDSGFDPYANLSGLLRTGAVVGYRLAGKAVVTASA